MIRYVGHISHRLIENVASEFQSKLIEDFFDSHRRNFPNLASKSKRISERNYVMRFGSDIPYPGNIISKIIPPVLTIPVSLYISFNSVTINEYLPGGGILPHIDKKEGGEEIHILSLLSDCEIVFSKIGEEDKRILLPRNSLFSFRKDLRYKWKHSIPSVTERRLSVVYRDSR